MVLLRLLLERSVPRFVGYSIGFVLVSGLAGPMAFAAETAVDRTILPIKEPARQTYTELDARNAPPPPRFQIKAPQGAPNVLVILIDDMGFGVSSAFGGPARMPTVDRLAEQGLRYNNFHTTAPARRHAPLSTSRSSATAPSTTMAGMHASCTARHGQPSPSPRCRASSGSASMPATISVLSITSPPSTRTR